MSKWTYDPTESIQIGTSKFHLTPDRKEFIQALKEKYPNQLQFTKEQFNSVGHFPYWLKSNRYQFKDGAVFNLSPILAVDSNGTTVAMQKPEPLRVASVPVSNVQQMPVAAQTANVNLIDDNVKIIPEKMSNYVPFGHAKDVKNILKSKIFFPFFVTGLSGNGKTLMIEQIHAELKKELIRVNITIETDEDDLLGGFRLVGGETKFVPGPVIEAMERGCTLLLDECDLGSNKLLALQPVLEGKGVFLKKINKWITAKPGFNVMATANTKGKGSEDGRFIGTNILNEAFLERFAITLEQPYPTAAIEKKIVIGSMLKYGDVDNEFATNLVTWAEVIRKTFYDGGVDEVISTRRLDHIVKAHAIFDDRMTAIEMCVNRFDDDTKASFIDLYTKVDATTESTISTFTILEDSHDKQEC
jgi:MoxR-like ATPase